MFDLSPNCTNNCSSNGICSEDYLGCECFEGYYLRDCSLNSTEYESFLSLKKRVYQLTNNIQGLSEDESVIKSLSKMKSKLSQGGELFKKLSPQEINQEI